MNTKRFETGGHEAVYGFRNNCSFISLVASVKILAVVVLSERNFKFQCTSTKRSYALVQPKRRLQDADREIIIAQLSDTAK